MAKYFIGALVPRVGADIYDGCRFFIHRSERDALLDMADWVFMGDPVGSPELTAMSNEQLEKLLQDSDEVQSWKVEEVSIDSGIAPTLKALFPWLGTEEVIDFRDECVRMNDFYQSLTNCTCGRGDGKHHPNCPEWNEHVDNYEEMDDPRLYKAAMRLLRAVSYWGTSDLYTDAHEYRERVGAMQSLCGIAGDITQLEAHRISEHIAGIEGAIDRAIEEGNEECDVGLCIKCGRECERGGDLSVLCPVCDKEDRDDEEAQPHDV